MKKIPGERPQMQQTESMERPANPGERAMKCAELMRLFEYSRHDLEEFRGTHNYLDDQIDQAIDKVENKRERMQEREKVDPSLEQDKVLESVLYYMGSHGQIFDQECQAESGTEYDDFFNAADVEFALPRPNGQRDVVFNVDACSAVLPDAILKKFHSSDSYSLKDAPSCNHLDWYAHGESHTRISPSPHYTVGAMPAHVTNAVDKFRISENWDISNEVDNNFRCKILIETMLQSRAGKLACNNVREKTDRTKKGYDAHEYVENACNLSLIHLFGIDENAPDAKKQLYSKVDQFAKENAEKDDTFNIIYRESRARLNEQMSIRKARTAARAAANLGRNFNPALA